MEDNTQYPSTSSEAKQVEKSVPGLEQANSARNTQIVTTDLAPLIQSRRKGGRACLAKYGIEHYRGMGKKGGDTTKQRHDADYYRRIGAMGREARRKKSKNASIEAVPGEEGKE